MAATLVLLLTGARRVGGGCASGRGLWATDSAGRETWNLSGLDVRTRTFGTRTLNRSSSEGANFPPIRDIEWAGDTYSYVDVYFDAPFRSLLAGEDFAPLVRYRWVPDAFTVVTNPANDIANAALPGQIPIGEPTSIRHYDRGACSADLSWRALAEGLVSGMDPVVDQGARDNAGPCIDPDSASGRPIGNWVITPILRTEFGSTSLDAFRLTRQYEMRVCGFTEAIMVSAIFNFQIRARFTVVDRELRFVVENVSVSSSTPAADPAVAVRALRTELAPGVNEQIPEIVGQVVETGGRPLARCDRELGAAANVQCLVDLRDRLPEVFPALSPEDLELRNVVCLPFDRRDACGLVPNFHRVYGRPEGVETVLSEWNPAEEAAGRGESDPLYPILNAGGACNRSSAPALPVEAGYFGSVFELPPANTPLPFGDEP